MSNPEKQPEKHKIPSWVTQGKTVRQLIEELQTFEDKDMEVRISLNYGDSNHACISLVTKSEGKYCLLENAENYYMHEWQNFMNRQEEDK